MRTERLCLAASALLALVLVAPTVRGTCDPCTNCSADPVFVQKDSRNPELVLVARGLRRIGINTGPIDSIAVVEGTQGTGLRIVIFEESGKRVEAEVGGLAALDAAVRAFLRLTPTPAANDTSATPRLVDPKAFLGGK